MGMLEGRSALVTGGSRGIGAAICLRLAREGARVAVNYSGNEAAAAAVVEQIAASGGTAIALRADVGDPIECAGLVERSLEEFGSLEVVVNNAGITRDGLLVRMSNEDWDDVIRTNLGGTFAIMRAAAKSMMRQRQGAIVNIASVVARVGNAGQANYVAAKAGVIGLTKSVARELASRNIRVNAIAPGFIETDMTAALPASARETALAEIALGYFGSPEDVAATVAFLASDDARYITGQVLAVDGGMTFV